MRFGSDKALAVIDGRKLMDHAIAALSVHAESVICCGRSWPGVTSIEDFPASNGGPLAGLNAALRHARETGFDAVLCAPVDVYPLPEALRLISGAQCAVLQMQWTVSIWPTVLGPILDQHLARGDRSFRSWLKVARPARIPHDDIRLHNINRLSDLISAMPSG